MMMNRTSSAPSRTGSAPAKPSAAGSHRSFNNAPRQHEGPLCNYTNNNNRHNLSPRTGLGSSSSAAAIAPVASSSSSSSSFRQQCQQQPNNSFFPRPAGAGAGGGGTPPREIVVFLVNAGLWLGQDGLVEAYDRGMSTATVKNDSVVNARPDIVHQCLLSIFDSEFGSAGRVRVFIYTTRGKTIEVSPNLRPPRTYERFKGLMATLLRDGKVLANPAGGGGNSGEGEQQANRFPPAHQQPLMQILQGSIAPMIPEGADVIGITNAKYATIATPVAVAEYCHKNPVGANLRGGRKNAFAFFAVDCRDEADPSEEPCVTKLVSLSPYPMSPHSQAIRLCEAFQFVHTKKAEEKAAAKTTSSGAPSAAAATAAAASASTASKAVAQQAKHAQKPQPQEQKREGQRRQRE